MKKKVYIVPQIEETLIETFGGIMTTSNTTTPPGPAPRPRG